MTIKEIHRRLNEITDLQNEIQGLDYGDEHNATAVESNKEVSDSEWQKVLELDAEYFDLLALLKNQESRWNKALAEINDILG